MKKAALLMVFVFLLLFMAPFSLSHAAAATQNYDKALDLKILGLFGGTDKGFELEAASNRVQGAVMLVRLLGRESEAVKSNFSHPFTDVPSWANCYIGYLYKNGLTSGTTASTYGSDDPLTALQYIVLTLRALGYDDRKKDFEYSKGLDEAVKVGLLSTAGSGSLKSKGKLLRDDLAGISYNALEVKLNKSDETLLDRLVSKDKAVSGTAAAVLGLYTKAEYKELGGMDESAAARTQKTYTAKSRDDLFTILRNAMYAYRGTVGIDVSGYAGKAWDDLGPAFDKASEAVMEKTGVDSLASTMKYSQLTSTSTISVTFKYRYSESDYKALKKKHQEGIDKARQVVGTLINGSMGDFDKELALHDYIVNNAAYDYENYTAGKIPDESYTAYGCLVLHKAVCQGYSEAMKLLCDLSGLECSIATGESSANGGWESHAWNIIKVDGIYYHLDATFDDPVMSNGGSILTHNWFNLTDSDIGKVDKWDKSKFPACTSSDENYYNKEGLIAGSLEDFTRIVGDAFSRREKEIEVKLGNYSSDTYPDSVLTNAISDLDMTSSFKYSIDETGVVMITGMQYNE